MSGRSHKHAGGKKHTGSKSHPPTKHQPKAKPPAPKQHGGKHQHGGKGQPSPHKQHHHQAQHNPQNPHNPFGSGGGGAGRGWDMHGLDICVSESLSVSLRLAGQPIRPEDTLRLHRLVGRDWPCIENVIGVAARYGLAGHRPELRATGAAGTVLGVRLPLGRHAVTVGRSGVWSWGQEFSWEEFAYWWPFTIEEIWPLGWS